MMRGALMGSLVLVMYSAQLGAGVAWAQVQDLSDTEMSYVTGAWGPYDCCTGAYCCEYECDYQNEDKCVYKLGDAGQFCTTVPLSCGVQDGCAEEQLEDPPQEYALCCLVVTVDPTGPCETLETGAIVCPGTLQDFQGYNYSPTCDPRNCNCYVQRQSPSPKTHTYACGQVGGPAPPVL